jgi:hypothetical protein
VNGQSESVPLRAQKHEAAGTADEHPPRIYDPQAMVDFKNQLVANKEDVSAMCALSYPHSDARKHIKFP